MCESIMGTLGQDPKLGPVSELLKPLAACQVRYALTSSLQLKGNRVTSFPHPTRLPHHTAICRPCLH